MDGIATRRGRGRGWNTAGSIVLVLLAVAVIANLDDIRRYYRISTM